MRLVSDPAPAYPTSEGTVGFRWFDTPMQRRARVEVFTPRLSAWSCKVHRLIAVSSPFDHAFKHTTLEQLDLRQLRAAVFSRNIPLSPKTIF